MLRNADLFAALTDDDWSEIEPTLRRIDVRRGDVLFGEGEPGESLYVVESGKVKISRTASDGRSNLLAILGPGDVLGELSLFDGAPRTATATAVVDSRLVVLDDAELRRWLATRPGVADALLGGLARRLQHANDTVADLIFADVPARVAKAVLALADRFGEPVADGVHVAHGLTQEELAQLVGASRETVNKALSDFAARGWLRVDGRAIVVQARDRLEHRAR